MKKILPIILIIVAVIMSSCANPMGKSEFVYQETTDKYGIRTEFIDENLISTFNRQFNKSYLSIEEAIYEEEKQYEESKDYVHLYTLCVAIQKLGIAIENESLKLEKFEELFAVINSDEYTVEDDRYDGVLHEEYVNLLWSQDFKKNALTELWNSEKYCTPKEFVSVINTFLNDKEFSEQENEYIYVKLLDIESRIYSKLQNQSKSCLVNILIEFSAKGGEVGKTQEYIIKYADLYVDNWLEIGESPYYDGLVIHSVFIDDIYKPYNPKKHTYDQVLTKYINKYNRRKNDKNLERLCHILLLAEPVSQYSDTIIEYYEMFLESNNKFFAENQLRYGNAEKSDYALKYIYALYNNREVEHYQRILIDYKKYGVEEDLDEVIEGIANRIGHSDIATCEEKAFIMELSKRTFIRKSLNDGIQLFVIARKMGHNEWALEELNQNRLEIINIMQDEYLGEQ